MKPYSLQNQLSKYVVFTNAVIFLVVAVFINISISFWLEHEFDRALASESHLLATLVKDNPDGLEFDFADEFMPEFEINNNAKYFQLWTNDKKTFEKSHSLQENELPYSKMVVAGKKYQNLILMDGRQGRMIEFVFYPQIPQDENITPDKFSNQTLVTLVLAKSREDLDKLINSIHVLTVFSAIIILLLVNFIIKATIKKRFFPLHSLEQQIKHLDVHKLHMRLDIEDPPSELLNVIIQFNQLLDKLEQSFYREQRFSSDIAHELRTPIAELRSMSEIALKWPNDTEMTVDFFNDVLGSSIQMQTLVNNLLALTRCEPSIISSIPEKIKLNKIVNDYCSRYHLDLETKKSKIIHNIPDHISVVTSIMEFDIILHNLIYNAVDYCDNESEIKIQITSHENTIDLNISNYTDHLETTDLDFMFDRLWRKNESRTSSEHSGLGLSLVKAYIDLLGLNITVSLSADKLFCVSILNLRKGDIIKK